MSMSYNIISVVNVNRSLSVAPVNANQILSVPEINTCHPL